MDTVIGRVPFPEEGTELFRVYEECEGCHATVCPGDAHDPVDAAARYGDGPWCPGHCWRFWGLVLEERRRSGGL